MKKKLKELLTSQWSDADLTKSKPSKNAKMMKGIGQELIDAGSSYSIARSIAGKPTNQNKVNDITVIVIEGASTKVRQKSVRRNPMITKVPPKEIRSVRVGDSIADILAKMYNLMWKKSEDDLKSAEVRKNFEEERESEDLRRHEQLLKAIRESRVQPREEQVKPTAVPEKEKEKPDDTGILSKLGSMLSGLGTMVGKIGTFAGNVILALFGVMGKVGKFISELVGGLVGGALGMIFTALKGILTSMKLLTYIPGAIFSIIKAVRWIAKLPIISSIAGPVGVLLTTGAAAHFALSEPKDLVEELQVAALTGNLEDLIRLADQQAAMNVTEATPYDPEAKYRIAEEYLLPASKQNKYAKAALEKFIVERELKKKEDEAARNREVNVKKLKEDIKKAERERLNTLLKDYDPGGFNLKTKDQQTLDKIDYLLKMGVSPDEIANLFSPVHLERYYESKKQKAPKLTKVFGEDDSAIIDRLMSNGWTPEQITAKFYSKEKLAEYYDAKKKAGTKPDYLKSIGDFLKSGRENFFDYMREQAPTKPGEYKAHVIEEATKVLKTNDIFGDMEALTKSIGEMDLKNIPKQLSELGKDIQSRASMPDVQAIVNSTTNGISSVVDPVTASVRNSELGRAAKQLATQF